MLLTSMLLVTSVLSPARPAPPAVQPDQPAFVRTAFAFDAQTYGAGSAAHSPHRFGIGASLGGSIGRRTSLGGSFRYWFGDRVGMEMNAAWTRYSITPGYTPSFVYAMPSLLVTLTPVKTIGTVEIRPYAGGGPNYVHSSTSLIGTTATGGTGMQAFGGAEMTFQNARQLAISGEVRYTHAPFSTLNLRNGTYFLVEFHYYLR